MQCELFTEFVEIGRLTPVDKSLEPLCIISATEAKFLHTGRFTEAPETDVDSAVAVLPVFAEACCGSGMGSLVVGAAKSKILRHPDDEEWPIGASRNVI